MGEASINPYSGGLRLRQALDFDQSAGTGVSASPALVYNSDTILLRPVVAARFYSDPAVPLPTNFQVQLTWNGAQQTSVTYPVPSGSNPGDIILLSVQAPAGATPTTGAYPYTLDVLLGGSITHVHVTGTYFAVANDASPYGAGWQIDGLAARAKPAVVIQWSSCSTSFASGGG